LPGTGAELSVLTPSKTHISGQRGARSGAFESDFLKKYPNFTNLIDNSDLPKDFKKALVVELKQR
jgi:hypothetical protein